MQEGKEASQSNLESDRFLPHKERYPGARHVTPEEELAKMSAEGYEPPESVIEPSRESVRYQGGGSANRKKRAG
jgi:hypothetical protein